MLWWFYRRLSGAVAVWMVSPSDLALARVFRVCRTPKGLVRGCVINATVIARQIEADMPDPGVVQAQLTIADGYDPTDPGQRAQVTVARMVSCILNNDADTAVYLAAAAVGAGEGQRLLLHSMAELRGTLAALA